MIVKCNSCQTKFRIDPAKITEKGVRVRCTKCSNIFFIEPQIPVSPPPNIEPPKEENISFDIDEKPYTQPADAKEMSDDKKLAAQWSMDISFDEEKSSPPNEKSPIGDGDDFEIFKDSSPADSGFSFALESKPAEEPQQTEALAESEPAPYVMSEKEGHAQGEPPALTEERTDGVQETTFFSDVAVDVQKKRSSLGLWLILLALFTAGIGGAVYMTDSVNTVIRILNMKEQPIKGKFDIVDIKGYYSENAVLGRLFVVEGKIISSYDVSKDVTGIRGKLFNSKGNVIEEKLVSPGVIILSDDLKTVSNQDLGRLFTNTAKSRIPAKGSMPFMVIFTDIPPDTHEFSVEIVV